MNIEERLLLEENELKPNRYVADAVLFPLIGITFVDILNEFGVFHVELLRMRVCCLIVLFCTAVIQPVGRSERLACRRRAKYYVLAMVLVETLAITVVISQWTELMIALPVMLALTYHNRRVTGLAIAGSLFIAAFSEPLSVLLGFPQADFYEFLLSSTGVRVDAVVPDPDYDKWAFVWGAFKYISIPRCVLVAALGPVSIYVTRLASCSVQGMAVATCNSSTDILTGLYNRFSYEEKLKEYDAVCPEGLICVYADADGLHAINNEQGHAAGDELLRSCARCMTQELGELTYRLGGDEFLSFVESGEPGRVEAAVGRIAKALKAKGYHLSLGVSRLEEGMTVDALVQDAEQKMYAAKRAYYTESGKDRRRNR